MNFAESVERLPFNPSTETGRGFVGPLFRMAGHLLYILGNLHNAPTRRPSDAQILTELEALGRHFSGFNVPEYLSNAGKQRIDNYVESLNLLINEMVEWDHETRVTNVRAMVNRTSELGVFLDRELLGITDSDAGQEI